ACGPLAPYRDQRRCWRRFVFSSRRRHTRSKRDWSSDVCSSDLVGLYAPTAVLLLDIAEERGSGPQSGASRTRLAPAVASALFKSPLLISAFVGMILAWMNTRFGFELPALVADRIDLIAQSMVAVALVVFGMSMAEVKVLQPGISPRKSVLVASLLKTVLHPTIAFLVGTLVFGASGELLLAMVLMGALPT